MEEQIIDVPLSNEDQQAAKKRVDYDKFLFENKWTIGFVLLGLLLLGIGLFSVKSLSVFPDETRVEVLGDSEVRDGRLEAGNEAGGGIVVEIAGEIQKPGVYPLIDGDRVADLLTRAGGLSVNADRDYVAKNINLAQKLVDGAKIYIPVVGEKSNSSNSTNLSNTKDKININTATIPELDTLWGVGETTAKKIIAGRPYQKPEELLQRKIVNSNVWETIKDKITTW